MAVVIKPFMDIPGSDESTAVTIKGLISETSTLSVGSVNVEASHYFLNSLYQTLLEAGYEDTEINEEEYYVTILGAKLFCIIDYKGVLTSYIEGNNSSFTSLSNNIINGYRIIVRGGKDNVSIKLSFADSNGILSSTENYFIMIFKAKNIISGDNAYIFCLKINYGRVMIREKSSPYNPTLFTGTATSNNDIFTSYQSSKGNNTSEKFAVVPQLAYQNCYVVPGMIQSNNKIFADDKYYKLGTDTYYCDSAFLYRVD